MVDFIIMRTLYIATENEELFELYVQQSQKMIEKKYIKNEQGNVIHENMFRDSGVDLFVPIQMNGFYTYNKPITIDHEIICALFEDEYDDYGKHIKRKPLPYYLYPRSSISKTPFRLANSVGIIDSGYRGHIMAKVDMVVPDNDLIYTNDVVSGQYTKYHIENGTRLFQICCGDLLPIDQVVVVKSLDNVKDETLGGNDTSRGGGGFGSTGV